MCDKRSVVLGRSATLHRVLLVFVVYLDVYMHLMWVLRQNRE